MDGTVEIIQGENLDIMTQQPRKAFDLIYMDPPFNTGKKQALGLYSYHDKCNDYLGFIVPRLERAFELLKGEGSLFVHLDYREVHYVKVELDKIFGRECFMNEIIWAYDYGGRATKKWPAKHDNILWYVRNPKNYCFNYDEMDRIPYMAPGLVGKEKEARGKTPTDCWWNTIVHTTGKERTGYPTQKPLAILERIVKVHSKPGDKLLDPFAGSGSFGEAAARLGRHVTLIDNNPEAAEVMNQRLRNYDTRISIVLEGTKIRV